MFSVSFFAKQVKQLDEYEHPIDLVVPLNRFSIHANSPPVIFTVSCHIPLFSSN